MLFFIQIFVQFFVLQQLIQDVMKPEKGTTKKKNVKIFEQKHVFVESICRLQRLIHDEI